MILLSRIIKSQIARERSKEKEKPVITQCARAKHKAKAFVNYALAFVKPTPMAFSMYRSHQSSHPLKHITCKHACFASTDMRKGLVGLILAVRWAIKGVRWVV